MVIQFRNSKLGMIGSLQEKISPGFGQLPRLHRICRQYLVVVAIAIDLDQTTYGE